MTTKLNLNKPHQSNHKLVISFVLEYVIQEWKNTEVDVENVFVGEGAVGNVAILKCHAEMSAPESAGWSEVLTIVSEIEPLLPAFQPLRWIGAARDTT